MIKSQHVWCSMLSCLAARTKLKKNQTSKSIFSLVNSIQCDGHNYFFLLWKYVGTFHVKFVHRRDLELNTANCRSFSVKSMPHPHASDLPLVCGMCPTKTRQIVKYYECCMFSYPMFCTTISTPENVDPKFHNWRNQNEYKNPENNPMQSCRSFLYALVMVESDTSHIE